MANIGFPSHEQVQRIRQAYPKGTRIELVSMEDPYSKLRCGDQGTVIMVDDAGQIHMQWDSGSTLALIPGVDCFRTVSE